MIDEKEKGAADNDAPEQSTTKVIVASDRPDVNKIPAWMPMPLAKFKLPRNDRECDARVKNIQHEMGRKIDAYAYEMGVLCRWKKYSLGHGNFLPWVRKNCYQSVRTIQNFMDYSIEAEMSKKYLGYNPNKKNATVAYLDSPDDKSKKINTRQSSKLDQDEDWVEEKMVALVDEYVRRLTQHCNEEELESFEDALITVLRQQFVDHIDEIREGRE